MAEKVLKKRVGLSLLGNDSGGVLTSGLKLNNDLNASYGSPSSNFINNLSSGSSSGDSITVSQLPYIQAGNGISLASPTSVSPFILRDTTGGSGLAKAINSNGNGLSIKAKTGVFETNGSGQLSTISTGFPAFSEVFRTSSIVTTIKISDSAFTSSKIASNAMSSWAIFDSIFTNGLTRYNVGLRTNQNLKVDINYIRNKITFTSGQFTNSGANDILSIPASFHGMSTNFTAIPLVSIIAGVEKIILSATVAINSSSGDITITVPTTTGFNGAIYLIRNN